MKYLHLIWASLFRRKVRTILTLLSVLVAFLLFGLLDTVRSTFTSFGQSFAGQNRLVTVEKRQHLLPLGLLQRIQKVPGVVAVEPSYGFTGTYQDPKNVVGVEAHRDTYHDMYPELEIASGTREAFRRVRDGALAGEVLMRAFKWKIGDKIPLKTSIARKEGGEIWTFELVGTYSFKDPGMKVWENTMFVNWDGFEAARESDPGMVSGYFIQVTQASEADRVARAIDALSTNSGHETKTQSENAFSATSIGQLGDLALLVTSVMGAVFFTLLLLTGHTMMQAVHERTPEMAALKTIGFSGKNIVGLVLSESVFLLLIGAAVGLAMASLATLAARSMIGSMLPTDLPIPIMPVSVDVWLRGVGCATLIGLIVGMLPALRGLRLRIVDALSDR